MVSPVVKYRFRDVDYYTDQGSQINLNPFVKLPSDITQDSGLVYAILNCVGAVIRDDTLPCSEKGNINPRKIKVLRKNGNSFSLTLPVRSNALNAAQCLYDALQSTQYPAVCIELIGEHSPNLIEELATSAKQAPNAAPIIAPASDTGKNTLWYVSAMAEYKADARFGQNVLMPFKSQTNTPFSPYIELTDYFETCVDPLTTISCPSSSSIDYRRYIPTFLTIENDLEKGQTVTAPVNTNETGQIKSCGEFLANLSSVICLAYFGESNKKLHKLINK
jgi:hypothetical protein